MTLDNLSAKGHCQIERYLTTTPHIKQTIEQQLSNVQESYNSLLDTAKQIKSRLEESLEKFMEYERTLESIMSNLDEYEEAIQPDVEPTLTLEQAQHQLEATRVTVHFTLC